MAISKRFIQDSSATTASADTMSHQVCPKCQSKNTTTAAKRPTENCYWRCLQCGEVWNPRLLFSGRQWWQR